MAAAAQEADVSTATLPRAGPAVPFEADLGAIIRVVDLLALVALPFAPFALAFALALTVLPRGQGSFGLGRRFGLGLSRGLGGSALLGRIPDAGSGLCVEGCSFGSRGVALGGAPAGGSNSVRDGRFRRGGVGA